jgi:hypothetical protein
MDGNGIEHIGGAMVLWVDPPSEGTSGLIGDVKVTALSSNGQYARTEDGGTWHRAMRHGIPGWESVQ